MDATWRSWTKSRAKPAEWLNLQAFKGRLNMIEWYLYVFASVTNKRQLENEVGRVKHWNCQTQGKNKCCARHLQTHDQQQGTE